ncbi:MAG: hypothetical protein EA382_00890 [Spirochaetaceae bacterium]|nr:MAG: hypothetical protein EA382_00890 [Spirochaetaceae bacterium]
MSDPQTFLDAKWERLSGVRFKPAWWLSPETFYSGVAWYRREIDVPSDWKGLAVRVEFERPHWETTVWIDGILLGSSRALSTPHRYLLPADLSPGRHTLTVRIDNRYLVKIGAQAHSITDNTNGNWNGIVGDLKMHAEPAVHLAGVVVTPDPSRSRARLSVSVCNGSGAMWTGQVCARAVSLNASRLHEMEPVAATVSIAPGTETVDLELDTTDHYLTWSEWEPALYGLRLTLVSPRGGPCHELCASFGIRSLTVDGTTFKINDRPVFLRGTLECNIFPREGHTATDEAAWEYMYTRAREYGFNHFRFHSWCPPDAAFRVADRLGFYLQVESCCWAAHETKIGDGLPVDQFLFEESERIVAEYGNHPSFCFLNYGNEGDGANNQAFLTTFVEHWKAKDLRRLYTSSSGWPQSPASDYHSALRARAQRYCEDGVSRYHINENPPSTDFDFAADVALFDRPLVSHEPGMWCVYPNFDEMSKYTGAYRARNFELYRAELDEHAMLDQWRDFLMASGKLQTICYKAEIEAMLRTEGLAGFQLLSLMDFPGQGTAIMAPIDVFYEEKGYTDAAEWRRFLGETVVLARIPSLILSPADRLEARLQTFHQGRRPLAERRMVWTVTDSLGTVLRSGTLGPRDVVLGLAGFSELEVDLTGFAAPERYTLTVTLAGTTATNAWEFFLFPTQAPAIDERGVHQTTVLDAQSRRVLASGGTVLLSTRGALRPGRGVTTGFTPVYWNTLCFHKQPIHTMGMLCDPRHPLFGQFPTQFHTNYQWWDLLTRGEAHVLDGAPPGLRPLVQMIDSYHSNRRLGLVTEMRALGGRLVLSGLDLDSDLQSRPGARQFRASLFSYLAGPSFAPQVEVSISFLESIHG